MIARQLASLVGAPAEDARRSLLGLDRGADTRPLTDQRASLPNAIAGLGLFSSIVAAVTGGPAIGRGFMASDLVVLIAFQLVSTAVIWRLPWWRVSQAWLVGAIGLQVVFVAGLVTVTGGSGSPFLALYAPVLAVAGWYLRKALLAAAYGLVVATEVWRAMVMDPLGNLQPIEVLLPVYGLLALLAWLASRWATAAAVGNRRDQVRTAATLHAVQAIGMRGRDEPPAALVGIAGRALAAEAWLESGDGADSEVAHACHADDSDHLVLQVGADGAIGFCRGYLFSTSEHRLAAILAGALRQAGEYRALAERCAEGEPPP